MRRSIIGGGIASIPAALLLVVCLPGLARAQYDAPPRPAAWALDNVTVVHGDGQRDEGMTLVVRGGVIETLRPGAAIPADARRIEWDEGVFRVYPGFVDAHGAVPVSFPTPDREGVESWSPTREVQYFTATRRTADFLSEGGEALAAHRRAGWIASVAYPGRGPIPGQPSLVAHRVDARTPRELVVDPSIGLALAFQGAQGAYPGTLMAVQAFIRQSFIDAAHHDEVRAAWEADPRGSGGPPVDEDLEVLSAAAAGDLPVYFRASDPGAVRRVLQLSDEIGFRPVIVGGEGSGGLAEELAARGVAVLLSTDLDSPLAWDPEADEEPTPGEARERARLLPVWETAGALEAAGVAFVLTSGGTGEESPLPGARRYVEHGLSQEGALRALTVGPAELLGVPGLARIEEGGAANFIVTDRDLFHDDAGIVWTFVDGVPERGRDPRPEGAAPSRGAAEGIDAVVGRWEGTIGAQQGRFPLTLSFEAGPDGLTGMSHSEQTGDAVLSAVELDGDRLGFDLPGPMGTVRVSGTVDGDRFTGSAQVTTPQGEFPLTVEFRKVDGGLQ